MVVEGELGVGEQAPRTPAACTGTPTPPPAELHPSVGELGVPLLDPEASAALYKGLNAELKVGAGGKAGRRGPMRLCCPVPAFNSQPSQP